VYFANVVNTWQTVMLKATTEINDVIIALSTVLKLFANLFIVGI